MGKGADGKLIFVGGEDSGDSAVGFGDDPNASRCVFGHSVSGNVVSGEDAAVVANGRFILPFVKGIEFAPVALEMAGEIGEEICVEGGGTGRHDDVAGFKAKRVVNGRRMGWIINKGKGNERKALFIA